MYFSSCKMNFNKFGCLHGCRLHQSPFIKGWFLWRGRTERRTGQEGLNESHRGLDKDKKNDKRKRLPFRLDGGDNIYSHKCWSVWIKIKIWIHADVVVGFLFFFFFFNPHQFIYQLFILPSTNTLSCKHQNPHLELNTAAVFVCWRLCASWLLTVTPSGVF